MGLDIKFPIGLMFTIFGVMLIIFGLFTGGDEMYKKSLDININLWSGIFMTIFGLAMLIPSILQKRKQKQDGAP
jgi:uncharacterized membrane protein YhaH (DUF805 family)